MHRTLAALAGAVLVAVAVLASPALTQTPGPQAKPAEGTEVATFAGGCFWCVEADFDKVGGVLSTVSGFMGGTTPNPTYKQVTAGGTGHIEVVQVMFDPKQVTYEKLVDYFWRHVDAYDAGGQFCDRGDSYVTAIFAHTPEQKKVALASKEALEKNGLLKQPVVTAIRDAGPFTAAEDYHQDYSKKNPIRYNYYRAGCGRDARIEAIWGKKATQ